MFVLAYIPGRKTSAVVKIIEDDKKLAKRINTHGIQIGEAFEILPDKILHTWEKFPHSKEVKRVKTFLKIIKARK
jgi:hypothetical protein